MNQYLPQYMAYPSYQFQPQVGQAIVAVAIDLIIIAALGAWALSLVRKSLKGEEVELVLTGRFENGEMFSATDCQAGGRRQEGLAGAGRRPPSRGDLAGSGRARYQGPASQAGPSCIRSGTRGQFQPPDS